MKRLLCPLLVVLFLLTACAPRSESVQFFAMDTVMSITAYGNTAKDALSDAVTEINGLEALLSRTREDSEIYALNTADGQTVALSDQTAQILSLAQEWSAKTGGAFDITVAPVVAAWGFAGGGQHRVPAQNELQELLTLVDSSALTLTETTATLSTPGMAVDLGGIAKGYAAGQAEAILRDHGVQSALLDLGHNITVIGSKPDGTDWRIAVQDPSNSSATVGILSLRDCSAVTSGGYQRGFEQDGVTYHHIIDPRTGYPADSGLLSATVICADPAVADILSTAVFVLGEGSALDLWRSEGGFELVLVTDDSRAVVTGGLAERFTLDDSSDLTLEYAH